MKISQLHSGELLRLLRAGELLLNIEPFVARLQCDVASVALDIAAVYADFEVLGPGEFSDFHVQVLREPGLRRWFQPQARFFFDGLPSFTPLPAKQGFAPDSR